MKDEEKQLDLKRISLYITILLIFVILIALTPLLLYYGKFKEYEVSDIPSDWSDFSIYISGTTGVLLSFFAVTFALISIYFTTRIAKFIQTRDFEFNEKQKKLELKLTHTQNKPYPYLDLANHPKKTLIIMQNMGLGTLIVSKIKVIYKGNEEFNSFRQLFEVKLNVENTDDIKIKTNTAPNHVLGPNAEKSLLKITPESVLNESFESKQLACRNLLKDCNVLLEYEDIFGNKFNYSKELSFLK